MKSKPAKGTNEALTLLLADAAPTDATGTVAAGFRGVAYSGGIVPNHGWSGNMAIDLSTLQLPSTDVVVLRNHDPNQIVGRARLLNDGNQLQVVDGHFSGVTDAAKETSALMAEGHPWKLSIAVNARQESADPRKPTKLNGRSMQVDTVLRRARVTELSFVPSGADPSAYAAQLSARGGNQQPRAGDEMDLAEALARITELEGQNTTLAGQVTTITGERDAARTELATATAAATAAALARRNERLTAIFGAEPTLTAEQIAAYRGMSDDQFAAVEATLASVTSSANGTLFQQQASAGRNADSGASGATYAAPAGWNVDPERAQVHAKALKYQAEHAGTDYLTAVNAVAH